MPYLCNMLLRCCVVLLSLLFLQPLLAQYHTIDPPEHCSSSCSGLPSFVSPGCIKCLIEGKDALTKPTIHEWKLPLEYRASYFASFSTECGDGKFTFACMITAYRVRGGGDTGGHAFGTDGLSGKVGSSDGQVYMWTVHTHTGNQQ